MKLSIKHKIFFTLLLTSIVVATSLHLFLRWNLDRGFAEYVNSQELEQLDKLAEQLTNHYKSNGNWQFIRGNHHLWQDLHSEMNSSQGTGRHPGMPPPPGIQKNLEGRGGRPGSFLPPPEHREMGPRVVLFDMDKNRIIGGNGSLNTRLEQELRPVSDGENIIGYLGITPAKTLVRDRDRHFVKKQMESFALIPLFMVVLSLLLSYPITMHLLRPIKALTEGTRQLIGGLFATRIPVITGDELGRLSEDFNILAMTLEKNEQNRRQWVADVSHELRTPLAILRGEVEGLQDGIRRPDEQTLNGLHGEIMHLERMVGDLYELSMSDIGALNYKKVELDPVSILQGTVELFAQRLGSEGLSVQLDPVPVKPCTILADPDRLQQLYINLLENSLRYTDLPGKMVVKAERVDDNVVVTFADSSPGVVEEQLPRLFDRLYRVEASRNRATGGAGLGLAICKNIVDAHQGQISADNSPLGGLLITIQIPLNAG